MNSLAQSFYDRTVWLRESHSGVVREQRLLFCGDEACMSQGCQMAAQIGLIEVQNILEITDTQGPVLEQVEYAKSVRVSYGF
jgi:hypothetical protein